MACISSALQVMDYCYRQDDDRAQQLLTYELKNWSKQTCLSLAVADNHRALLSHTCCQILLADLWLGGLRTRKNTNIKVKFIPAIYVKLSSLLVMLHVMLKRSSGALTIYYTVELFICFLKLVLSYLAVYFFHFYKY